MQLNIIKLVENYASSLLSEKSPVQNVYHSLDHTKEVVAAAIEIANGEHVTPENLEIVTIAAWFHDLGYTEKTFGHEEISAMFASGFLTDHEYDSARTDRVLGCILATKVPQQPQNHVQQIMCDADLSHMGRTTFEQRNNLFRAESAFYKKKKMTDFEFLFTTIEFMQQHRFFTRYAQNVFLPIKEKNLLLLQRQLEELNQ